MRVLRALESTTTAAALAALVLAACAADTGTFESPGGGTRAAGKADFAGNEASVHFADMGGHWAQTAVDQAREEGWVSGFPAGPGESLPRFRPGRPIARGHAAIALGKAFGVTPREECAEGKTPSDVPRGHIARGYVCALLADGILALPGDGRFRPDDTLTFAETVTVLGKLAGWDPIRATGVGAHFIQGPLVEKHWAAGMLNTFIERGALFVEANRHNLDLDRPVSRAEAVAMLWYIRKTDAGVGGALKRHQVTRATEFDPATDRWTTEQQLVESKDFMIEQFWARATRNGELTSGIPAADGRPVKLSYVAFETPTPAEERAALVVINGRTETYLKYAEFTYDMLAQVDGEGRRYSIYMMDHRGQGFSDRIFGSNDPTDIETYHKHHIADFCDYVIDQKQFVDYVVKSRDHAATFALGHSMGGGITTAYAQGACAEYDGAVKSRGDYQDDFDAVVLSAPMHQISLGGAQRAIFFEKLVATGRYRLRRNDLGYPKNRGEAIDSAGLGAKTWSADAETCSTDVADPQNVLTHACGRFDWWTHVRVRFPETQVGGVTWNWLVQSVDATGQLDYEGTPLLVTNYQAPAWNMLDNAAELEAPTLLLQAAGDTIVGAEGQERICAGAPNCELQVSKANGVGSLHEAILELDPIRQQFMTRTLQFLERH